MATWSTVGAGDGPQTTNVGADDNNEFDFGDPPAEDPWAAYGDGIPGGERGTSDGWSWANNEKVDEGNKDDLGSQVSGQVRGDVAGREALVVVTRCHISRDGDQVRFLSHRSLMATWRRIHFA